MSKSNSAVRAFRYLGFEVCLIPHVKKSIADILSYSIMKYAQTMKGTQDEIINEIIRRYYDDKELPASVFNLLTDIIGKDSTRGYDSTGVFDPLYERGTVLDYIDPTGMYYSSKYASIMGVCTTYYQLSKVEYELRAVMNLASYKYIIENHRSIKAIVTTHELKYGPDAQVMIKTGMFFEFRDGNKSHEEFELFKAFLAIKSIQGKNDFAGTNKNFICARMIGAKTPDVAKLMIKSDAVQKEYNRFSERYFFDKLIVKLQASAFIIGKISYGRSMYLSTQLDNELLWIAIANYRQNKHLNTIENKLKTAEKEYRNKIFNELNIS